MKNPLSLRYLLPVLAALVFPVSSASAKDKKVSLAECPAPVQAVIQHYAKQATLEDIAVDNQDGQKVYEAKFTLPNGKRTEAHIAADGKVLKFEDKGAKGKGK
jgi:hypothetical protein